jgi:hypothetical protein
MYEVIAKNGSSWCYLNEVSPESNKRLSAGQFAEEVNQIPSFTFSMSPGNPAFDEDVLHDRRTIIEVKNTLTDEVEFEGTVLMSTQSMNTSGKLMKTAVCEGFLGYLCDSVQNYRNYSDSDAADFLTSLLTYHNNQVVQAGYPEKQITLGLCNITGDNTNSKTTAYRNTLEEIKVNLIERLGGEIQIRKVNGALVLDYLDQIGTTSSTPIALADNMQSLEVRTDPSNIVSLLIPLGAQLDPDNSAQRLDITSVNSGSPYLVDQTALEKYGPIAGTVIFDDITVAANLKAAGQNYIANNNRIRKAYRAQALDLSTIYSGRQSIRCGNTYPFSNELLGINNESLRIMKRTVDIFKPYKPVLEIGDKAERMTDIATRSAQLISYELPKQKQEILASAKATATALINAGINGYVVVNGNEILIMDTPDKATATKVWRWNSGGFGYSSTGYSGTYGTAITMNGAIVADFITAGVLRGMEILNGNGKFHVHTDGSVDASAISINNGNGTFRVLPDGSVVASAISITGGSVNITTQSGNTSVIDLDSGNHSYHVTPAGVYMTNSLTDLELDVSAGAVHFMKNASTSARASVADIQTSTGTFTTDGDVIIRDSGGNISLRDIATRVAALENA